jgi:hypothetical protein
MGAACERHGICELALRVHSVSTTHPYKQTFVNCNILVILIQRIFYSVKLFMKLSSCYLEHLDSLRLRHANRLMSWVVIMLFVVDKLHNFQTNSSVHEINTRYKNHLRISSCNLLLYREVLLILLLSYSTNNQL